MNPAAITAAEYRLQTKLMSCHLLKQRVSVIGRAVLRTVGTNARSDEMDTDTDIIVSTR